MRNRFCFTLLMIAGLLLGSTSSSAAPGATPLGTAFTYQGRLDRDGEPYTGTCDFQFSLWESAIGGSQIGTTIPISDLSISNGLFTVPLDFGSEPYNGYKLWVEVAAMCAGDVDYTILGRQELTAAPFAIYAISASWEGLDSVPSGFADNVDDDTQYSAGEGLLLSDTTFSIDSVEIQSRVNGSCAMGSTIQSINEDGSVECQSYINLPSLHKVSIIDSYYMVGTANSITIGADGLGLISYSGGQQLFDDLKVAHCSNIVCSSATNTIIDDSGVKVIDTSITIGADWMGLISYYDVTSGDLKVAHCNDTACSSATTSAIDSIGVGDQHSSMTVAADGLGLISYYDISNQDLKVAHCNDALCSDAIITILDSTGDVGLMTSIALGADGQGLISYRDNTNGVLKVAHCNNLICTDATTNEIDTSGDVGGYTSITIGTDMLGLISYQNFTNSDLKVAHCDDITCTTATFNTLDSIGDVGANSRITVASDGMGLISYFDETNNNLKVAHCNDLACSSATINTLDSTEYVGMFNSITIGVDSMGLISYWDYANYDLKVVHCGHPFCIPYFRRR